MVVNTEVVCEWGVAAEYPTTQKLDPPKMWLRWYTERGIYVGRWLSGYAGKYSAVKPLTTVVAHCKLLKLARQLAKSQSNRIDFRRSFWV